VLRIEPGAVVEVFDGRGGGHRARVAVIAKKQAVLEVEAPLPEPAPFPLAITLATAVPKGDRFEWLVEKATELGVARLVPLRFERSVVEPRSNRLDRLRRRVVEACKQCGRLKLMEVAELTPLSDYLAGEPASARFLAHPGGQPLAGLAALNPGAAVSLVVGPEGGLTGEEVALCEREGWCPVSLGPTILRVETAALAAVAGRLARVNPVVEQDR
jgi:16S rRNA (uracil1498-N3)-methyltransferase